MHSVAPPACAIQAKAENQNNNNKLAFQLMMS